MVGQVEAETLNRSNELDEMREQLESRKLMMGNTSMQSKVVKEKVKMQEEQLGAEIKSLLVAGSALSVASKHLQVCPYNIWIFLLLFMVNEQVAERCQTFF